MLNRGSLDVQHRANQSNRRRNLTDPGNSPQTAKPGAAEQIEQHGFALVLRVVCRRNQVQVTLLSAIVSRNAYLAFLAASSRLPLDVLARSPGNTS